VTATALPTNQRVNDLLRRLASSGPEGPTDLSADDYDWRIPHRFLAEEIARLDAFAHSAAENIARKLGSMLRAPVELSATPVTQHYAASLKGELAEAVDFCIGLVTGDSRPAGSLVLEAATAKGWVSKILGGSVQDDSPERQLSTVERGLMLDIATVLIEAITAASTQAEGPAFRHTGDLTKGAPDLGVEESVEYTRLSLTQEGSEQRPGVSLVILSEVAETIVSGKDPQDDGRREDVERDIRSHLEQLTVEAAVRLGLARVSMRDLLCLEPGDVLVSDTRIGEPVELQVDGQDVLAGVPVQSSGRYALMITTGVAESGQTPPGMPA